MILSKLQKSVHGKSAMARYKFLGGSMHVYLQHNKSATKNWGTLFISCHIIPTGSNPDIEPDRYTFSDYAVFRNFRNNFILKPTK